MRYAPDPTPSSALFLKGEGVVSNSIGEDAQQAFEADAKVGLLATRDERGRPAGPGRLAFSPSVFAKELASIPAGAEVAVFGLNLKTESVLLRGPFSGWRGVGAARVGMIDIEWVYNSMPPVPGQIFPPVPLEAVCERP